MKQEKQRCSWEDQGEDPNGSHDRKETKTFNYVKYINSLKSILDVHTAILGVKPPTNFLYEKKKIPLPRNLTEKPSSF